MNSEKIKKFILLLGDVACFYAALFLMLEIRFGFPLNPAFFRAHFNLFSLVFLGWVLVFYIGHLYEISEARNEAKFFGLLLKLQIVNFILAIIIFYFIPVITPKTNLAIVAVLSFFFIAIWRFLFNSILLKGRPQRVLIISGNHEGEELAKYLRDSPQIGYEVVKIIEGTSQLNGEAFSSLIHQERINTVVVDHLVDQINFRKVLFETLFINVNLFDLAFFYEMVLKKIPLSVISESWFFINLNLSKRKFYDGIKRIFDAVFTVFWLFLTLPFWPLIILLIKIDSVGPIFYKSLRIGKDNKPFTIFKFRTMVADARTNGPHWTEKNDKRITRLGRFLRKAHIDEFPQLLNILKGEMSFVGPRPEEVELVKLYSEKIPFYNVRHLVKPGVVGWAQLNYPHGASVDDAVQKLQYDFYYLKNRSLWLDLSIIIRTIRIVLTQPTH